MGALLFSLPVLAMVLAALDCVLVRFQHPWRASDVRLFFQTYYVYALIGLVALAPAAATLRAWEKLREGRAIPYTRAARPWVALFAWMALPVVAHATLDRYTSLVGFAGLAGMRPWMELAGVLAASGAALHVAGRLLAHLPGMRTATVGAVLALLAGIFLPLRPPAARATAVAARPNLLLLVWDTARSDKLEPYGYERPTTPGLLRLADEALVFEDSLSVSSFTFTSHLSMLTGVLPSVHGARMLDMRFDPGRATSIAQLLRDAGYRTGAFVGTDVLAGRTGIREGFEVYDDVVDPPVCDTYAWQLVHDVQTVAARTIPALRNDGRPHWFQDFQRPASEVLTRALAWIGSEHDERPWFCFVNLYDVHWPYLPQGTGRSLVRPYDGPLDGFLFRSHHWVPGYEVTEEDARHVADLYEGELHDLDRAVSAFLAELELDAGGTAVLLTSDHGEGLGEEDIWTHDDVREPQVRVPFVLRPPEPRPRARRVTGPVSGIDVAPTLLALAGVPRPESMEGLDLSSVEPAADRVRWIEDRDHPDPTDVRIALYRENFKLVRTGLGERRRYELFDLARDALGTSDRSADHPELFAELVERLETARVGVDHAEGTHADPGAADDALRALGYAGE